MKKETRNLLCSILNFTGGVCFLLAALFQKNVEFSAEIPPYALWLYQYGFYVAAMCCLIAGAGFLYIYCKRPTK